MSFLQAIYRTTIMLAALLLALSGCAKMEHGGAETAAQEPEGMNDAAILGVLQTLNDGEIAQAQLALQTSQNPDVLETAQLILDAHRASNADIARTAKSLGIQPRQTPLSDTLRQQAMKMRDELARLSGEEFDQAYLQGQVELHEIALDTVEEQLLPYAQDPLVIGLLRASTPELERHQEVAEEKLEILQG